MRPRRLYAAGDNGSCGRVCWACASLELNSSGLGSRPELGQSDASRHSAIDGWHSQDAARIAELAEHQSLQVQADAILLPPGHTAQQSNFDYAAQVMCTCFESGEPVAECHRCASGACVDCGGAACGVGAVWVGDSRVVSVPAGCVSSNANSTSIAVRWQQFVGCDSVGPKRLRPMLRSSSVGKAPPGLPLIR